MYRFLIFVISLMFLTEMPIIAQQEEEDEPLPPKHHAQPKIGGAGGFTQNLLFLNLDPINEILKTSNATPFDKNPLLMLGGQGYGYILILPNLRVGGMGASGSMKSPSYDRMTKITRDVELSAGYGGVTIDYVIPVVSRLDISLGILLGSGSLNIKMTRDSGMTKTWDDIWNSYGSTHSVSEYSRTLSGSFFIYQPTLNVEYAVLRWLGLRVGVSYYGMAGNSWKIDEKYDLRNVPSNISGKGFMINGGIFLGTFLY